MSTALYRRYRPDTFQQLIGQNHVTEPLMAALAKDRVNHAYLFSGPRGCGKTTSARILARCLNCHQGPTAEPCGQCPSCQDLATGGAGSLDVVEIDAASHGGVDDARELRERATFAPARDRYKIFIIDEAHMVTSQGFNALLKIVEEPPEHLKFIFATTEPDKVIGTIRSRTHHYPFRLVPPETLLHYLEGVLNQEGVSADAGVLSLVIRAGGGSVRDSLSVLDQLISGAAEQHLDYDRAVALLGFTHAALLDDVVDALASDDAATLFRMVDHVVQGGQDPRRFVEDLLERFRDLIIIRAVPDHPGQVLHGVPEDVLARMQVQAHNLSPAQLSLAADTTNDALSAMVGATSPRLQLELLMARLLLPSAEHTPQSLAARLERLEARMASGVLPQAKGSAAGTAGSAHDGGGGQPETAAGAESQPPAPRSAAEVRALFAQQHAAKEGAAKEDAAAQKTAPAKTAAAAESEESTEPVQASEPVQATEREQDAPPAPAADAKPQPPITGSQPNATGTQPSSSGAQPNAVGSGSGSRPVERARRLWPEIIQDFTRQKRILWILLSNYSSVTDFDGQHLVVNFTNDGARQSFINHQGEQLLLESLRHHLGVECTINIITGPAQGGGQNPQTAAGQGQQAPRPQTSTGQGRQISAGQGQQTPRQQAPRQQEPAANNQQEATQQSPQQAPREQWQGGRGETTAGTDGLGPEPDWSTPEPPPAWPDDPHPEGSGNFADQAPADMPPSSIDDAEPPADDEGPDGGWAVPGTTRPQRPAWNPEDIPVPSFARPSQPNSAGNNTGTQSGGPHSSPASNPNNSPTGNGPANNTNSPGPRGGANVVSERPRTQNGQAQPTTTGHPDSAGRAERPGSDTEAEALDAEGDRPELGMSRWQQMMAQQQAERLHHPDTANNAATEQPGQHRSPAAGQAGHPGAGAADEPGAITEEEEIASDDDLDFEQADHARGRQALIKVLGATIIEENSPGPPR